jgi:hypothetical protein
MFDRFFDALNVAHFCDKRKPLQAPYYSESDSRLTVSGIMIK